MKKLITLFLVPIAFSLSAQDDEDIECDSLQANKHAEIICNFWDVPEPICQGEYVWAVAQYPATNFPFVLEWSVYPGFGGEIQGSSTGDSVLVTNGVYTLLAEWPGCASAQRIFSIGKLYDGDLDSMNFELCNEYGLDISGQYETIGSGLFRCFLSGDWGTSTLDVYLNQELVVEGLTCDDDCELFVEELAINTDDEIVLIYNEGAGANEASLSISNCELSISSISLTDGQVYSVPGGCEPTELSGTWEFMDGPSQPLIANDTVLNNTLIYEGGPGIYNLQFSPEICSMSYPVTVEIAEDAPEVVEIIASDEFLCPGEDLSLFATIESNGSPYHIHWSTGEDADNITVNEAGLYTVTVSNACGQDTASFEVIQLIAPYEPQNVTSTLRTDINFNGFIGIDGDGHYHLIQAENTCFNLSDKPKPSASAQIIYLLNLQGQKIEYKPGVRDLSEGIYIAVYSNGSRQKL